jgi:hypothetical protein
MKTPLLLLLVLFLGKASAQNGIYNKIQTSLQNNKVQTISPFKVSTSSSVSKSNLFKDASSTISLNFDLKILEDNIKSDEGGLMELNLPTSSTTNLSLLLMPVEIFKNDFKLTNSQGLALPFNKGKFYHGFIKGDSKSVASICITNGEVSGVISNAKGNLFLEKDKSSSDYFLFKNENLKTQKAPFQCFTEDSIKQVIGTEESQDKSISCKVVGIFIEADYHMYQQNGNSISNVANYVYNLFNQTAMIYNNENVAIRISELKVWDVADPYVNLTSTSNILSAYTSNNPTFNGQLAHFISTRSLGGGVAWIDVLCSSYNHAVSAGLGSLATFPSYSWSTEVFAHEMGHNFGSPHTHSCSWPGGAIDNCGPTAGYAFEGSCTSAPTPAPNTGTIMSYCHLVGSVGINFSFGFGLLPGNLLRNRVSSSTCLSTNNVAITQLWNGVGATTASLFWTPVSGGTSYTLQYKLSSSSTWTTVSSIIGPSKKLIGLLPNTTYDWKVMDECNSIYSATQTFTTGAPVYCTPIYSGNGCNNGVGIRSVLFNAIYLNQNTGCASPLYTLYPTPIVNLIPGQTNNFTIDLQGYYNAQQIAIWIDYNQDYEFTADEKVFATTTGQTAAITGSFTVPSSAVPLSGTRMRIRNQFFSAVNEPCGTLGEGEAEDFVVNIMSPCPNLLTLVSPTDDQSTGTVTKQANATTGKIVATNKLTVTGTKATYEANSVELNQGFSAEKGTVFKAQRAGCN